MILLIILTIVLTILAIILTSIIIGSDENLGNWFVIIIILLLFCSFSIFAIIHIDKLEKVKIYKVKSINTRTTFTITDSIGGYTTKDTVLVNYKTLKIDQIDSSAVKCVIVEQIIKK